MARRQRASIGGTDRETEEQRQAADENKGQAGQPGAAAGTIPTAEEFNGSESHNPARSLPMTPNVGRDRGLPRAR